MTTGGSDVGEQLELLRAGVRKTRPRPSTATAAVDPVAVVHLELPVPHLDRTFDYAVPRSMEETARPGVRVRVRFGGQDADGFLLRRAPTSDHRGPLLPLRRVVGEEQVLTPEVLALARAVATRQGGTLADVLRLAVPPRHAATEKQGSPPAEDVPAPDGPGPWQAYRGGPALLERLRAGEGPRAVWTALPGRGTDDWPHALAVLAATAAAVGRGALLVLPDHRDVDRAEAALTHLLGPGRHVRLTADTGPAARYRAFLAVLRGSVRVVVGTRAAAFAPVQDLGLVVCWDDGDDLHAEPRAPYPHARDVLALRAEQTGAAFLAGSLARSVPAQALVARGWAREVVADRDLIRTRTPRVRISGDDDLRDPAARSARLPSLALRTAREALADGPVLVQVPRTGYVPALTCGGCRAPARCAACHGPLALTPGERVPSCRWCARLAADWRCERCDRTAVRFAVVGAARTAEELGRAFPGVPVRSSGGAGTVLARVGPRPALVVATPGAEPVADGGYAAALLLDTWSPLSRPDLRAAEEAVRRWLTAASLVRAVGEGGRVVAVGDAGLAPLQALVRWDPAGFAARDLDERTGLLLPPAVAIAAVEGDPQGVRALLDVLRLPGGAEVLGPLPVEPVPAGPPQPGAPEAGEQVRALVRAPRAAVDDLGRALHAARGVLSVSRTARLPRVRMDPPDLG